jgi:hypothetical protein
MMNLSEPARSFFSSNVHEFRSLGNRKNYLKSTKTTLQGNDVRVYLCLHCTIIFAIHN